MAQELVQALDKISLKEEDSVNVSVDGRNLVVQKKLLTDHVKYCKAFITFAGGKADNVEIGGGIVDYETAKIILSGLENNDYELSDDNIQTVFEASTYLQCDHAEIACVDYMKDQINRVNCFSLYNLALHCGSPYLGDVTSEFIEKALNYNISMFELSHLTLDELEDHLDTVVNNYVAFLTVCGWALYDLNQRGGKVLEELLTNVIFELIPYADCVLIQGLEDEPAIQRGHKITEKYDGLSMACKIKYWRNPVNDIPLKRWPMCYLVMCSSSNSNDTIITYRDEAEQKWIKLTSKPSGLKAVRSGGAVTVVRGKDLYFVGGEDNYIWSYDLHRDSWRVISAYKDCRSKSAVVSVGKYIYSFGGYLDSNDVSKMGSRKKEVTHLVSVNRFDTETERWTTIKSMDSPRHGALCIHYHGKIYLFGGLGSRGQSVVSCDAYDIESDSWSHLTDLPRMFTDFGMALLDKRELVLVGGYDPLTLETMNSTMSYNFASGTWKLWPTNLNVARSRCASFVLGNYLYVAGGWNAYGEQLASCERMDLMNKDKGWKLLIGDALPKGLSSTMFYALQSKTPVRLMANYRELTRSQVYF